MIKVDIQDKTGKKVGSATLEPKIFEMAITPQIIQHVVVAQQANARPVVAHTKGRSEVRGGGKKPWRQKGTGRARHGSIRSPLWKGGGVTFGPRNNRNYSQKVNRKTKRQALFMSLSDKASNKKIVVLDSLDIEKPKTKLITGLLKSLKIDKALVITSKKNDSVQRAARNISKTDAMPVDSLNVVSVMKHSYILFSKESLKALSDHFLSKK